MDKILTTIMDQGWSADNLAFGSGGGLLQKVHRDTCQFAFKCSHIAGLGFDRDVYKQPVTDLGKQSKRGRLKLLEASPGQYCTVPAAAAGTDVLRTVFCDGMVVDPQPFRDIRARAAC